MNSPAIEFFDGLSKKYVKTFFFGNSLDKIVDQNNPMKFTQLVVVVRGSGTGGYPKIDFGAPRSIFGKIPFGMDGKDLSVKHICGFLAYLVPYL